MQRFCFVIGYDGTDFAGSQIQPGRRTVQGELERVVQQVAPGSGRLIFAGRTDRGVHAVGQVVSGDVAWGGTTEELRAALNAVAPFDLVVARVSVASPTFHARFDAQRREYRYRIHIAAAPPVLERRFVWWRRRPLNAELAQQACAAFIGRRNFGSFAGMGRSRAKDAMSLVRTVYACDWHVDGVAADVSPSGSAEERHELRVVADGFLPNMVRNMTTAIRVVAEGERPVAWVYDVLSAVERSLVGEAAPPHGLTLHRVWYGDVEQLPDALGAQVGE
ncbi:MAG: tRNA pseudouridine(38-40) synthase TruA [Chloroflexi bacterium]|nr:MAG: tRNA pseudouridine(38-40) synthase TruA [Chloroflexota bacterium]